MYPVHEYDDDSSKEIANIKTMAVDSNARDVILFLTAQSYLYSKQWNVTKYPLTLKYMESTQQKFKEIRMLYSLCGVQRVIQNFVQQRSLYFSIRMVYTYVQK